MRNKIAFTLVFFIFIGCTKTYDNRTPNGYPFYGNDIELNYRFLTKFDYYLYNHVIPDTALFNKSECNTYLKSINPICNCDDVNFEEEILVHKKNKSSYPVLSGDFKTTVTINNIKKNIKIKNSIIYTTGPTGVGTYNQILYFNKWIIIPKPPKNYQVIFDNSLN